MELLNGAVITLRYDPEVRNYIAHVFVGFSSKEVEAKDPVRAIGLAVILQAGFTERAMMERLKGVDK